ncbi:MAG: metallophosphoesterase family protein [Candidatus Micrarchaeota archaeon]|nr:metallophosphoesterase family protein [Candidatus Micrarchaeota archaeon]
MKIAFVTDMHFGYRRFEEDASSQGREAILAAAAEADLIILGGDNFDTPLPRMETIAEVTGILREAQSLLAARGAHNAIFGIHGNHDRRAKGFVHPTDLLAQGGFLQNFHNKTLTYEHRGHKVAISGMGSVPEDMAVESLKHITCRPVSGAFNVFVVHQSFQEFERIKHEDYLTFDDLPDGYDLYLCGHVHQPSLTGKVLNPGSTVVTQLREDEAGQRGWLLYDTHSKKAEFKPIKSRELAHKVLEFNLAKPDEIRAAVEAEVRKLKKGNNLVKIVVKGTLAQGFHSSDLRLQEFGDEVFIDNSLNSENLRERIEQIKQAREKKTSVREQGMAILRKKLEGTSYALDDPEKVFEELLAGTFLPAIKEKIEKEGKIEREGKEKAA